MNVEVGGCWHSQFSSTEAGALPMAPPGLPTSCQLSTSSSGASINDTRFSMGVAAAAVAAAGRRSC